jgi:N-methylhydantoinase A/oxoprolinase/acetone carboxylase beta subunit
LREAIDTGGTFTDCVYLTDGRLQVVKLFTTAQGKPLEGRNW